MAMSVWLGSSKSIQPFSSRVKMVVVVPPLNFFPKLPGSDSPPPILSSSFFIGRTKDGHFISLSLHLLFNTLLFFFSVSLMTTFLPKCRAPPPSVSSWVQGVFFSDFPFFLQYLDTVLITFFFPIPLVS